MKRILFVLLTLCLAAGARAQFYDTEVHYYIKQGTELTNSSIVWAFTFDGRKLVSRAMAKSEITAKFRQDANYMDELLRPRLDNPNYGYDFDEDLTTPRTVVYASKWTSNSQSRVTYNQNGSSDPIRGRAYIAFTQDRKRMVTWNMEDGSEEVLNKEYYVRVEKARLLPRKLNVDEFFR